MFQMPGSKSKAPVRQPQTQPMSVIAGGAAMDFTGIPAGVNQLTLILSVLSTTGTANPIIQLGSGGILATGYFGGSGATPNAAATAVINNNTGFTICGACSAATILTGTLFLNRYGGNSWAIDGNLARTDAAIMCSCAGIVSLGGMLDRLRLTTDGADTFDAGSVSFSWRY